MKNILFILSLLALVVLCAVYCEFNITHLFVNGHFIFNFITEDFFPPKFNQAGQWLHAIIETLAMAIAATSVASILAISFSIFGSEYISPSKTLAKCVRSFATFLRNIPTLVWAFILFSSLGIGTGVGFIALTITSFAFLTRAFIETIDKEAIDSVEALEAVGASFSQRIIHAVIPNSIAEFISWTLYSLEVSIRSSTIVGMVGGGGIGMVLISYLKIFKYHNACGIILAIALMVLVVECLTAYLRKKLKVNL